MISEMLPGLLMHPGSCSITRKSLTSHCKSLAAASPLSLQESFGTLPCVFLTLFGMFNVNVVPL